MTRRSAGRGSGNSRRRFLKSTGALALGVQAFEPPAASGATAAKEKLALFGGPPAVAYSPQQQAQASRWPIYGAEEEKAVVELVRHPSYGPIAALEKDWRDFCKVAHVRAHCNGTSALASMFFALDLPPGSEILVPSYTF